MSQSRVLSSVRRLRSLLAVQQGQEDSDEQLLAAFAERHEEVAFAALVRRHGPMVLGVCRRVLGHVQDAEDAYQATFLVLARRAAALRNKTALASFLYGTAFHLASKIKRAAGRRRKHEGSLRALTQPRSQVDPGDDLMWREVRTLLDEEIAILPEKYRSVFVLCCLENVSQAEAGRRLGVRERTVSSRLAEARKRLSQRLARRGVELTAVLAATELTTQSASALPAALMATTFQAALAAAAGDGLSGIVSSSVVELVQSAASAMMVSKVKIAAMFLLTATLLAGAGAWTCRTLTTPQSTEQPAEPPASPSRPVQSPKAAKPQKEQKDSITVTGRVLDPEGKPVEGARLYWPREPKKGPKSIDLEFPVRATTDAEGRFRFELPRAHIHPDWKLALVAAADGYGVDAVELSEDDPAAEVTLRLVKDQPIEGRILSTEGKPLAGVRVRAMGVSTMRQGRLDDFLTAWQQKWRSADQQMLRFTYLPMEKECHAVTDRDGRFRVSGAGAERVVQLRVSGPGIAHASLHIISRAGFDPAPVNKTALELARVEFGNDRPPLLYGPTFTYVAPPGRRIEGTVREAGSGKPVAGSVIYCCDSVCDGAISDKEGRYRLDGAPRRKQYLLNVELPAGSSWLPTGARPGDAEGLRPLHVDFTVSRGIVVVGRVLDRTTGRGVRGQVRFVPLPGNRFAREDSYPATHTEADGRFQLAVFPGPGVLMFQASGGERANGGQKLNPYKQAEFDAKDRERVSLTERGGDCYFISFDRGLNYLNSENAVKYIDLAPDVGTATCDLFVERGATQTIRIEDPDGKPLMGTTVAGVQHRWPMEFPIKAATCTIVALNPKKPRPLFFYHAERNLAGSLTVCGDEKGPLTVRLVPVGTVTGRLLDREGQPLAGAVVELDTPEGTYGRARLLYSQLRLRHPPIRTDKNGRFRLEWIVPEVKFKLNIYHGRNYYIGDPPIGEKQVKADETLDLGAIRVKPAR